MDGTGSYSIGMVGRMEKEIGVMKQEREKRMGDVETMADRFRTLECQEGRL